MQELMTYFWRELLFLVLWIVVMFFNLFYGIRKNGQPERWQKIFSLAATALVFATGIFAMAKSGDGVTMAAIIFCLISNLFGDFILFKAINRLPPADAVG